MTPEQILELLKDLLVNGTYVAALAPLVVLLTSITKRFIPLGGGWQALIWQVVVWAIYAVAQQYGFEEMFMKGADTLRMLLEFLLSFLPAVYASALVASKLYGAFKARRVPLLGYYRT